MRNWSLPLVNLSIFKYNNIFKNKLNIINHVIKIYQILIIKLFFFRFVKILTIIISNIIKTKSRHPFLI